MNNCQKEIQTKITKSFRYNIAIDQQTLNKMGGLNV